MGKYNFDKIIDRRGTGSMMTDCLTKVFGRNDLSPLWIADMDGESVFSVKPNGAFCLVIGNEGHGVSQIIKEKADFTVSIPMENGVESLNAAVSAGILMYGLKKNC